MSEKKLLFQDTFQDRVFNTVNYILLTIIFIITAYPLWFVLCASFSDPLAVVRGQMWFLPIHFNLKGYQLIFSNNSIMTGYLNSIKYTVLGTVINIIVSIMVAYPLSRKDFAPRGILMKFMAFTMFFSGGMIPMYLLISSLGIKNTIWAVTLPAAISTYNMTILRTYMQASIPWEIQESSLIDGCNNIQTLVRIVLPLCKPVLAVLLIFYAVGHWNAFFNALLYLTDPKKHPLQLILRQILVQNDVNSMIEGEIGSVNVSDRIMLAETIKYGVMVVASAPMLMIYPFVQKYFVQGVMMGAIKG